MDTPRTKKFPAWLPHVLFFSACAAILAFLLLAPPESTPPLPHDPRHQPFQSMKKSEAEQGCTACHRPGGQSPLPKRHPPPFRCLFCHKQDL